MPILFNTEGSRDNISVYSGNTVNISRSGILLETICKINMNNTLNLRFKAKDLRDEYSLTGRVVRCLELYKNSNYRYGLELISPGWKGRKIINNLIQANQ